MLSSKNWPVKGLCGRYLSEFIDSRYSQSCWYLDPSLWTVAPLTFSLVQLSPPSPVPVNKYTVLYCTSIQCVGWGGGGTGFWASDRWTPAAKSLYRSIFLDDDNLDCLLWVFSFYALDDLHTIGLFILKRIFRRNGFILQTFCIYLLLYSTYVFKDEKGTNWRRYCSLLIFSLLPSV
jgi:hypothetical protein